MTKDIRALDIFEEALILPSEQRPGFIVEACAGDRDLQSRVETLLVASSEAADLLPEHSAGSTLADRQLVNGMTLAARYVVQAPIGTGGMGEVFRAVDTRLGRDVAIKVLNRASTSSPNMRRRFQREIESVAALSHPNIVTLHDVGDHDDFTFAVLELVSGRTLRDMIVSNFLIRHAAEISHLDNLCAPRLQFGKSIEGVVQRQEVLALVFTGDDSFIQRELVPLAATFLPTLRASMIDQQIAHCS